MTVKFDGEMEKNVADVFKRTTERESETEKGVRSEWMTMREDRVCSNL